MRNVIRADLSRIIRKKSLYFVLLLTVAYSVGVTVYAKHINWNSFHFMYQQLGVISTASFLFGLVIFWSVYADEFKAMSMICAIGRGISRSKVILAKFLNAMILAAASHAAILLVVFATGLAAGAQMDAEEGRILLLTVFNALYKLAGCLTFASLVIYLTSNIPFGIFSFLFFDGIMPSATLLLDLIPAFKKLHINRYLYDSLAGKAYTDFLIGLPAEGTALFLLGFLLYVGICVTVIVVFFERKELEF